MGIGSLYLYHKIAAMYVLYKWGSERSRVNVGSDQHNFCLDAERLMRQEFKDEDFARRKIATTAPEDLDIHIKQRLERAWRSLGEFGAYNRLHQSFDRYQQREDRINGNAKIRTESLQVSSSTGM